MEPIKVQITLDLSERALRALEGLSAAISAPVITPASTTSTQKPADAKEAPAQEVPAEQAAQDSQPEAAAAVPAEDLPITDDELRQIVKEARDRASFPAVRALFNEFGIKASIECPMERRAELVDRLKNLKA